MKKPISEILNFFAFGFLIFSLYLNFIHKDNNQPVIPSGATASVKETPLGQTSEYNSNQTDIKNNQNHLDNDSSTLKLSFN